MIFFIIFLLLLNSDTQININKKDLSADSNKWKNLFKKKVLSVVK